MLIDTHAHMTDQNFANLSEYLQRAADADVRYVLSVGTTLADSLQCVQQAVEWPAIRAAVGIHPNNCCQAAEGDWAEIETLCKHPRVAALGETGLDKYWDDCPWDTQVDYFTRHIELSRRTELPIVVHTRDCAEETLAILQAEAKRGPIRGVMHSFTGPAEVAEGCLELGMYISFAGMVTFKNAQQIQEVARTIPAKRILVETDSPYLTPVPFRGKRPNEPAYVAHTAAFLADLRGEDRAQFASQTTENAERLFGNW